MRRRLDAALMQLCWWWILCYEFFIFHFLLGTMQLFLGMMQLFSHFLHSTNVKTHTASVNVQITNTSLRDLWSRRLVLLQFQPLEPLGQKVWDQESWSFVDRIQEFKMIQGIPMKCYKITRFLAILTINMHHPYAITSMNFCFLFWNLLWKILPNDTLHTFSSSHHPACELFFFWHIHYPHFF